MSEFGHLSRLCNEQNLRARGRGETFAAGSMSAGTVSTYGLRHVTERRRGRFRTTVFVS
jgi:hypothetical protein